MLRLYSIVLTNVSEKQTERFSHDTTFIIIELVFQLHACHKNHININVFHL